MAAVVAAPARATVAGWRALPGKVRAVLTHVAVVTGPCSALLGALEHVAPHVSLAATGAGVVTGLITAAAGAARLAQSRLERARCTGHPVPPTIPEGAPTS